MTIWTAFPPGPVYARTPAALKADWARLHAGDAEPLPRDGEILAAWALFHAGEFQRAVEAGLKAGGGGLTVANKAQAIHANYLEPRETTKLALFNEIVGRAEAQRLAEPANAGAHYWLAYALGRCSQGSHVAEALSQGVTGRIKAALEAAIGLAPAHADAHIALGLFHAEVIDRLGSLLGRTQGASKEAGLALLKRALRLNPHSALGRVEYANGLVMLEGDKRLAEAEQLYADAAACEPADAMEWLEVEMAKVELGG